MISGTPTTAGSFNVVVTVTDSESPVAHNAASYTIPINNPTPPIISTSPAPPAGALNVVYPGFTFAASGGVPPMTWRETGAGALPSGLILSTDGALSGTPTATGAFPITVNVQDSLGQNATPQNFTIQISARAAGFTATGSLGNARAYHTATLLASGEVLVTGGSNGRTLAEAELYDPSKKAFTPTTGNMLTPRSNHTATLLCDLASVPCNNQKVLVTGGSGGSNDTAIAEAELYDPTSGTFSATGTMGSPRAQHTATLLNDGRVLIAGGKDNNGLSLATAELYDPKTGEFTPTASPMATGISNQSATLLTNGTVLIAGGGATGELFDPISDTFTATANMGTYASFLTATLLQDGRVLLAGGGLPNGFCSRSACSRSVSSAMLFEASSASFSATGQMSTGRASHTASLLTDGKVLIAGGLHFFPSGYPSMDSADSLDSAELFDPVSGSFSLTGSMTTARGSHTATVLNDGAVLVIGGLRVMNDTGTYIATAELYQ
jgi:hypothetical protein